MAHSHQSGHHHHDHSHGPAASARLDRAFIWGIALNLLFVLVEATVGFYSGSLALLTDAGHNLSDAGSLALSLMAFWLAKTRATTHYSYGYRKSTVLASLANAILLLVAMGGIGYEALRRLSDPPAVPGLTVAAVAAIGIAVNAFTAWLFHHDRHKDLNARGAYLHLAADAAVSAGVVIAGLLMYYTGWRWLDPLISFVVLGIILWSTWGLLRDSMRLSLDGVPPHINIEDIRKAALRIAGVRDIHHIHVWAMSTTETALTAHLVIADEYSPLQAQELKHHFQHALEHLHIQHATLETESETANCDAKVCC